MLLWHPPVAQAFLLTLERPVRFCLRRSTSRLQRCRPPASPRIRFHPCSPLQQPFAIQIARYPITPLPHRRTHTHFVTLVYPERGRRASCQAFLFRNAGVSPALFSFPCVSSQSQRSVFLTSCRSAIWCVAGAKSLADLSALDHCRRGYWRRVSSSLQFPLRRLGIVSEW